jgi:O-succinylbenzoic acid--CoA ligase
MTETATHIALRRINGPDGSDFFHCLAGISVGLSPEGCLTIDMPGLNGFGPDESDMSGAPLTTNDLAELIDRTTFRILGRADHVIISGGIKYFPETIEKKLENAIEQPFFIGSLPDEILGRRMVLVIEAVPDNLLEKRVTQLFVQYLDRYERPKKIVFKKPFKRTETGKIIRQF